MSRGPVYLDHNATSPPRPEVLELALPLLSQHWANPSSTHQLALRPASAVEEARERLARWAGARPREIIFTSGATEANQLVLRGARPGRRLCSAVEHPSVLAPVEAMDGEVLPVDGQGRLLLDALEEALERSPQALVSVMAANNETGVIQPIEAISERVRRAGGLLHVDATQVLGRLPGPPEGWDFLTLTGHKAGGLKGSGALILRPGLQLQPQQLGGSQERGRRGGTHNVPAIAALGLVASLGPRDLRPLQHKLETGCVELGLALSGAEVPRLSNTVHLHCGDLEGGEIVAALDMEGVCASTGSACASGAAAESHVLAAMGLPPRGGLRLSMGWSSTEQEVDAALRALAQVLQRQREALSLMDLEDWT